MKYQTNHRVMVPDYVVGRSKYQGEYARMYTPLVNAALPIFRKYLEFSDTLNVVLKPIRGGILGVYDPNTGDVEVDYRDQNEFSLMSILAHELVHAEQYYQKRFDSEWTGSGYMYKWNDEYHYINGMHYSTYSPPWEEEALRRQYGLALVVCAELGV